MAVLLLAALALQWATPPDGCGSRPGCRAVTAEQAFAVAEERAASGDLRGAEAVLEALAADPHPQWRAEARFRLAALRERRGDLAGAIRALRDLLAEEPTANAARLELARLLAAVGRVREARAELRHARAWGLPEDVRPAVERFASALRQPRTWGVGLELTAGPDSNLNRSTGRLFIDTIIAPFELSPDARRQGGLGLSASARSYWRADVGGATLLSNLALRGDLSTKAQFNDVQLALDSGPELVLGAVKVRPAAMLERRWFGQRLYSNAIGAQLELLTPIGRQRSLELAASAAHQAVTRNSGQTGIRTSLEGSVAQTFAMRTTVRLTVRRTSLNAQAKADSITQWGGGFSVARSFRQWTVFGDVQGTRSHGSSPLPLFGMARRDRRTDLTAGCVLTGLRLAGLTPLVRVTRSVSRSNIGLYDYARTRVDVGLSLTLK